MADGNRLNLLLRRKDLQAQWWPVFGNYCQLVETMANEQLSPATIRDYTNIVKWVLASSIDENGEERFPRKRNDEYIDASFIGKERQPTSDGAGVSKIVLGAIGHYRMLYTLILGNLGNSIEFPKVG